MRILDIDLDFFLDEIAYDSEKGNRRLNKNDYIPWNIKQVECFLEKQFKLDKGNPIKGKYFIHHDEVFSYLNSEIENGTLTPPFSITHVDAHSDLATGMNSTYLYIMEDFFRALPKKVLSLNPPGNFSGGLNSGNFLIYLAAFNWLTDLTFVKHHDTRESYNALYFKDNDTRTNIIQIKAYENGVVKELTGSTRLFEDIHNHRPVKTGRKIKYKEMVWCDYKTTKKFDLIFLTQSPNFTPRSSDKLIPTIKKYMIL